MRKQIAVTVDLRQAETLKKHLAKLGEIAEQTFYSEFHGYVFIFANVENLWLANCLVQKDLKSFTESTLNVEVD